MYPHFIEVHWCSIPISFNVENITWFGDKFLYIAGQDEALDCDESYSELKTLIEGCGCLIHKADPRLDTSNPITKQMIMSENMVGEPVWNSNNGRWYQIANWANHEDQFYMELQGVWEILKYTDKELKKFPLYRIKQ